MIIKKFFFNKKRIGFGIIVFLMFNIISIWFIREPAIFIRNFLMREKHIQTIGILAFVYTLLMLYSFIVLLFRNKVAFVIADSYLIDNTKFESVGEIHFSEISKVKRVKKYSLEIMLKEPVFKSKRFNLLKKITHISNNWNYKNTIIVSSALLLDCERNDLEKVILAAMKKYESKSAE